MTMKNLLIPTLVSLGLFAMAGCGSKDDTAEWKGPPAVGTASAVPVAGTPQPNGGSQRKAAMLNPNAPTGVSNGASAN